MQSCLCLRSLLSMAENMLEIGSMARSHVLLETQADRDFSEALSAEVQPILSDYGSILPAAFAWSGPFSIFSDFFRFYLGHFGFQLPTCVLKLSWMYWIASFFETY